MLDGNWYSDQNISHYTSTYQKLKFWQPGAIDGLLEFENDPWR